MFEMDMFVTVSCTPKWHYHRFYIQMYLICLIHDVNMPNYDVMTSGPKNSKKRQKIIWLICLFLFRKESIDIPGWLPLWVFIWPINRMIFSAIEMFGHSNICFIWISMAIWISRKTGSTVLFFLNIKHIILKTRMLVDFK